MSGAAPAAGALVEAAVRRGLTIGTAESLTGGALAAAVVDVPGASGCFEGAVVSYSNRVKTEVLGVPAALLAERGSVDPDVAAAMAEGARRVLGTDWAVATTGVAGPEPHDGRPVGTVYLGLAGPRGATALELQAAGDRAAIRAATVAAALERLTAAILLPDNSQ
ncbi:damage-inducible protein CinA [Kocuria sp. CNJ-770]|uniref:CinA family protein n=1 Tax=Kocuria oceani TaxID=988827 RepID=A0ABV9THF2_9MICC|nr:MULTISPECIES: CinA family protein [Kocuria]OLT13184.1 damage-inducible protein CinA [Kocuria sp. CNJ-770]